MNNAKTNKSRFIRLTVMIAAIAVMTSSIAMGTFAKYATGKNTESSARVAKWGVTLTITGSDNMFVDNYDGTVVAADSADVVAPGTKNDTGTTFTIAGTPEVDTKITVTITDREGDAPKDVFLKFNDGTEYHPVRFTLTQTDSASNILPDHDDTVDGNDGIIVKDGTLADVKAALDKYSKTAFYEANTDLGASFKLTWKWVYEDNADNAISGNDIKDTILGDLAVSANSKPENVESYSTRLDYKISITVIQVD